MLQTDIYVLLIFVLSLFALTNIIINNILEKTLFVLLNRELNRESLDKQMKVAESIMKNVRHIHYRKFSEYITKTNKEIYCAENNDKICPKSEEILELNLQIYNMILKDVFRKALYTIIKNEIYANQYTYMNTEDFNQFIIDISKKISDYVWHEYGNQWLKNRDTLNLGIEEKREYLKGLYEKNKTIEMASFQLFHQTKLIQIDTDKKLEMLKKDFKRKPFSIINYIIRLIK